MFKGFFALCCLGMEKIELKKHKEVFKVLPEHEYEPLEQALEKGLYLSPRGVEGGRLGNERLERALPSLYNKFKKIEELQKNHKGIITQNRAFKGCLPDYEAAAFLDAHIGVFLAPVFVGCFFWHPDQLSIYAPLSVYSSLCLAFFVEGAIRKKWDEPCYSPNSLLGAGICYAWQERKKAKRMRLGKRIEKQEAKLADKILKITGSVLGYTENWLREQEKELLEILDDEKKEPLEFINAYNEVECRLAPLHKIGLHKNIEKHLYCEWEKERDMQRITEKFYKARNAGITLDSLQKKLKQELAKKRKHHTKMAKYHTEKTKGFGKLLEKIDG